MYLSHETDDEELGAQLINRLTSLPYYMGEILSSVMLIFLYVLLADWSYFFVIPPNSSAIFWLPSCIAFSLFIRARKTPKIWPYWLLALFVGEFYIVREHNVPVLTSLIWSSVNVILPLMVVFLSRRLVVTSFSLGTLRDVFTLAFIAMTSVIPSSLIAGYGTILGFEHVSYLDAVFAWGTSDLLGIILGAPIILSWTARTPKPQGDRKEALLLILALCFLSYATFTFPDKTIINRSFFSFLIFFVAWAAIRFGPKGTSLALLGFDLVQVSITMQGSGTFAYTDLSPVERIFTLQLLVANIGFLMLILAAAIEEQRAARLKAEEASKLRDDFISVASHELKTPLSSLMMQIQLLNLFIAKGTTSELTSEKFQTLIKISEQELKRFSHLVNDLLDVSRITAGRLFLNVEEIKVSELMQTMTERFKYELEQSGCELALACEQDLICHWDRVRIEQVITNLLSNAIKFGSGKPIELSAQRIKSDVVIMVKDHGIGISPENKKRIFKRFERAVTLKQFSGLGLGLYIVSQITEAHGGSVEVESELGKGSAFIVKLPLSVTG